MPLQCLYSLQVQVDGHPEGAASVMECALIVAERYAAKSGMDISAQAAEITASLKTRGGK